MYIVRTFHLNIFFRISISIKELIKLILVCKANVRNVATTLYKSFSDALYQFYFNFVIDSKFALYKLNPNRVDSGQGIVWLWPQWLANLHPESWMLLSDCTLPTIWAQTTQSLSPNSVQRDDAPDLPSVLAGFSFSLFAPPGPLFTIFD